MGILSNNPFVGLGTKGTGYQINQSLRFSSSDHSYLWKSDQASETTWSYSFWIKASSLYSEQYLWMSRGTNCGMWLVPPSAGKPVSLGTTWNDQNTNTGISVADPSGWYHIFVRSVETDATSPKYGEIKVYVNNVLWQTRSNQARPYFSYASQGNAIGRYGQIDNYYFDGYMAEAYFVDGTAYDPTTFGEVDINGTWIPKKVTGLTYGARGFYLKFDPSAANGVGHDHSGNGNHYTAYNFTTSGTGTDVMSDTPTNNWCTWNPINSNATSITNGNLDFVGDTGADYARGVIGTTAVRSGKWYFESTCTTAGTSFVGVIPDTFAGTSITDLEYVDGAYSYRNNGDKAQGTGDIFSAYGNSWTANDVIGVALDLDNGAVYFSKNGTWQNSGDPTSGSSKTGAAFTSFSGGYAPMACGFSSGAQSTNFGQRGAFAYTPPTGFKALNTANLPEPTIKKGSKYFNTVTYTGNGTARSITTGHSSDFVWTKLRNGTQSHQLYDIVRGVNQRLQSDDTSAEAASANSLTQFNSDGFDLGTSAASNLNGYNYVAWSWDANGAGSSNTAGTITSTVSANATAGFSIVTYTGNATAGATIGHGLGVAPKMVIAKPRSASGNWVVYHESIGNTGALTLQTTNGTATNIGYWNNTSPTSTVFSLGSSSDANQSGVTAVAYCFSEVAGYSKFGSYTGNSSSDGPFIHLGFRPRFIWIKATTSVLSGYDGWRSWYMVDTARYPYNSSDENQLWANLSVAEDYRGDGSSAGNLGIDLLSNGFKIRRDSSYAVEINYTGATYIYCAWAENPFKYANAR